MATEPSSRIAFVGGRVWTAGYAGPRELDVLVHGDRIAQIAPPGGLRLEGAETRRLDGRLLLPGFQDAHAHLGSGGTDLLTCNLADLESPEAVFAAIAAYADAHPELPWIIGGGWGRHVFPYPEGPTREQLDALVGDRPAVMSSFDRHGAWVSSAALRAAGLTDESPDPQDGMLRRDAHGRLTGMVEEEGVAAVLAAAPEPSLDACRSAVLAAQEHLLSIGITSVQDALVGTGLGMFDQHAAFVDLAERDEWRLRVTAALWWDPKRGLEQIPEIVERRRRLEAAAGPERMLADTVKMMVDGSDLLFLDAAALRAATIALDALGFTIHYHSYGDATTHWVLDAIEAAIADNGPRPRRHHIAHLFVVAEPDFARFGELGVTATIQGFWAGSYVPHDHMHQSTMTEDPEEREYPHGRLLAAGARLAAGSDWPITTADPLVCTLSAVGGLTVEGVRGVLDVRDRLDVAEMLTAYTVGSAFVNGRASTTGRIAVGFLADLVVVDGDVFAGDTALGAAVVAETWVGGQLRYQRGSAL